MTIAEAYNQWAASYDTVVNQTRDLEARALRESLPPSALGNVLELGCGTGKNTAWLAERATHLTAVDFSAEMLRQAQNQLAGHQPPVNFAQADITQPWFFVPTPVDVITCSLVLEHIQNLDFIFAQVRQALRPGGLFYLGELHPFKQYLGSKARFAAPGGVVEPETYVHHVSDFTESARRYGLRCQQLREWFDEHERATPPRLVSFVFEAG
ncbi:class I SAM-dependent methyltransferase [uncultured Hymenobacter sp.]|uniref:class I SAM-dependent methyltransferase n=1 Tax=uncultured Hymenobacter sp. TaxID=170016 RepID=UPI0035CB505C